MSFDHWYMVLSRVFIGAVAVLIGSLLIGVMIILYGDQTQAIGLLQPYKWYLILACISVRYFVSTRGLTGWYNRISVIIIIGHSTVLVRYFLLDVLHIPVIVSGAIVLTSISSIFIGRFSHWSAKLLSVCMGLSSIILLTYSLIPTYPHTINISERFNKTSLVVTTHIQDSSSLLRDQKAQIIIYSGSQIHTIDLSTQSDRAVIPASPGNTIVFVSSTKQMQTYITIQTRDGSVMTMMPQSSVTIGDTIISGFIQNYSTQHTLNQGRIFFQRHLAYAHPRQWIIGTESEDISCVKGGFEISSTSRQLRCEDGFWYVSRSSGYNTGEFRQHYTGYLLYSSTTNQRGSGRLMTGVIWSGYTSVQSLQNDSILIYQQSFDKRFDDHTKRSLSQSAIAESITSYKMYFLATWNPLQYLSMLENYQLYLFAKGKYQGGPIAKDEMSDLLFMRGK